MKFFVKRAGEIVEGIMDSVTAIYEG